jgi:hypothetical protein
VLLARCAVLCAVPGNMAWRQGPSRAVKGMVKGMVMGSVPRNKDPNTNTQTHHKPNNKYTLHAMLRHTPTSHAPDSPHSRAHPHAFAASQAKPI